MTIRKRYYRQGKLGPLYPGHGVGKLVLEHLQRTVQYVREYESEFVRSMGKSLRQTAARKSPQSAGSCHRLSGA